MPISHSREESIILALLPISAGSYRKPVLSDAVEKKWTKLWVVAGRTWWSNKKDVMDYIQVLCENFIDYINPMGAIEYKINKALSREEVLKAI